MDMWPLIVATGGLFVAGVIKGATGLGYASCALPFLVVLMGLKPAMSLVLIPAIATNFTVAFTAGHFRETLRNLWPLYIAMLPGIAVGLWLLLSIDQHLAVAGLGGVMIAYSAFALARPEIRIPAAWQTPLQVPAGFLNGVVTGLTGSQVMPLVPYVMGLGLESGRTVQAINIAVIIASVVLGIGLAAHGILTPAILGFSILAIVPAVLGTTLGNLVRSVMPQQRFRTIILIVLAVMGLGMLVRG